MALRWWPLKNGKKPHFADKGPFRRAYHIYIYTTYNVAEIKKQQIQPQVSLGQYNIHVL